MSTELGNAIAVAQDKYNGIVASLGAQTTSRLRGAVQQRDHSGADMCYWDVVGNLDFRKKAGRRARTQWQEANIFKRRGVGADTGELPIVYDEDDNTVLNYNIQSPIFQKMMEAGNRYDDDEIIYAFDADVSELDKRNGNTAPTTATFNATDYQISADIGAANSSLNHAKLRKIKQKFRSLEVSDFEPGLPNIVVSSVELDSIANEIQTEVAFKGDGRAMDKVEQIISMGQGQYFGFNWFCSERLGILGDDRKCFAWYDTGMILAPVYDYRIRMWQDLNESDAIKMRATKRLGTLRMVDDRVIRVLCDADATYNG